jgi:cysteinyl-tRNA synthetase
MAIRLYDSLTRELRELKPGSSDGVFRFYNCGPTVYAPAHIGNFRTFLVNDVIRRLLELEFGAEKVRHVRNLTDVDDKTIRRAREEGWPLREITRELIEKFHEDCDALNCLRPHEEPTATGHIAEQIAMIDRLVNRGHAYVTGDGSVYFKVGSFPSYGRLSRLTERQLHAGAVPPAAAADADEKTDGSDFALWKAWKREDGDVAWDSPWGRGRPGWHIECSAMIRRYLGETIDLHTGGADLLFPHHENEIAQSEACNGVPFARHWYHSEHLLVDGRKMSKSLGNLYTLDDLTGEGFSPMSVRYALLAAHPRKQLNFTLESLHAAEKALSTLRTYRSALPDSSGDPRIFAFVLNALEDDLNLPAALGALFTVVHRGPEAANRTAFEQAIFALGLKLDGPESTTPEVPAAITKLAQERWAARQARDFKIADDLRGEIHAAGWEMHDQADGYSLEPLKR